jgi:hypothetical protein
MPLSGWNGLLLIRSERTWQFAAKRSPRLIPGRFFLLSILEPFCWETDLRPCTVSCSNRLGWKLNCPWLPTGTS